MNNRSSNIELCRIISIMLVVLVHANFAWQGWPTSLDNTYTPSLFVEAFSIIGVNVFVMISGYFSIKPKLKSLINLFYICAFYAFFRLLGGIYTETLDLYNFLFITRSNWFIVSYLGLIIFAPIINKYIDKVDKRRLVSLIIILLVFEFYYGWFPKLCQVEPGFGAGYSVLSFIVIYIIGRYIRLYGVNRYISKYGLMLYILCSAVIGIMAYLQLWLKPGTELWSTNYAYCNPIVILSSVSFFCFFKDLKFKDNKTVNYLASSTLAILLLHANKTTSIWMKAIFCGAFANYRGITLYAIWIVGLLAIFVFSVAVDQIRILTYRLMIKNFFQNKTFMAYEEKINNLIS